MIIETALHLKGIFINRQKKQVMEPEDNSKFLRCVSPAKTHLSASDIPVQKKAAPILGISRKRYNFLWVVLSASVVAFVLLSILMCVCGSVLIGQVKVYIDRQVQERVAQELAEQQAVDLRKTSPESVRPPPNCVERIRSKRRSAKCKSEKRCRKKRNRNSNRTFVHLQGNPAIEGFYDSDLNFVWGPPYSREGLENLELEPSQSQPTRVKIVIRGVYLVYAQITVHGKRHNPGEPRSVSCAHQVIMHRRGQDDVILRSLVTQYCLGLSDCLHVQNEGVFPLDTKINMGVFFLHPNTELRVSMPIECQRNQIYSMADSYFGVVKLS